MRIGHQSILAQGIFSLVLFLFLFLALFSSQEVHSVMDERPHEEVEQILVPPKWMLSGYASFGAALVWVKGIFLYAEYLFEEKDCARVVPYLKMAIDWDPDWENLFFFAGLALQDGTQKGLLNATSFLTKGVERFPENWRLRIFLAILYQERSVSKDSIISVLQPLVVGKAEIPSYARLLYFSVLDDSIGARAGLEKLAESYRAVSEPLIQVQFQRKIGDLLWRNDVLLGSDSSAFVGGIGSMLDADSSQAASAKDLLIRLVQPETKDVALQEARHLARQFRSYQAAQLGTQR